MELTLEDLKAARFAMESWIDGPGVESEEDTFDRVRRTIVAFTEIIERMEGPDDGPKLRLARDEP